MEELNSPTLSMLTISKSVVYLYLAALKKLSENSKIQTDALDQIQPLISMPDINVTR
jgi:hypothetical protein